MFWVQNISLQVIMSLKEAKRVCVLKQAANKGLHTLYYGNLFNYLFFCLFFNSCKPALLKFMMQNLETDTFEALLSPIVHKTPPSS